MKDQFVGHALAPERTKALVFVFVLVFVLAHEQAISTYIIQERPKQNTVFDFFFRACIDLSKSESAH